jgi:hypothetical protein
MYANSADYLEFVHSARRSIASLSLSDAPHFGSSCRVEVRGSLRRGKLNPPYSDIDLLVIAPQGAGRQLRDAIPGAVATLGGGLLTIFVDPFSPEGTFCSIYPGPLKVDWFVAEESRGERSGHDADISSDEVVVTVWNGKNSPPYDWESHPWDWLWWLWCKMHGEKSELVSSELPKLWQFLGLHGIEVGDLPPTMPDPRDIGELNRLLRVTMGMLPSSNARLADEIRRAVTSDPKSRAVG